MADASSAVHVRLRSLVSVAVAKANSSPVRSKPVALAVPPLTPAKADRLDPPMARISVATSTPVDSLSVALDFLRARLPENWTKLLRFSLRLPLASVRAPSALLKSMVRLVVGPVAMVSGAALKLIRLPSAAGRLMATLMLLAERSMFSGPTKPALPASATRARHVFVVSVFDVAMARAKPASARERPTALAVPPLRPA
ncbi:MAG: hypothetical protein ACK55I_51490, partial [bacterium]